MAPDPTAVGHEERPDRPPPTRRMRALICAYACEPERGSEPGVGWNLSSELSKHADVCVLTRSNNRPKIERALAALAPTVARPSFIYHDLPRSLSWWKRGGLGVQLYYPLWQHTARRLVCAQCRTGRFDLTHHLTFGRVWSSSAMATHLPFVWGPLGGGDPSPPELRASFSRQGRVYERHRELAKSAGAFSRGLRQCARRATVALASTPATAAYLKDLGAGNIHLLQQMGIADHDIRPCRPDRRRDRRPFVLISVGRLLHWKGIHWALEAMSTIDLKGIQYHIVGEGPERKHLESQARRLGILPHVRFLGQQARATVLRLMEEADCLLHPAVHDQAPSVVLEAMVSGLPIVCLDNGGPCRQIGADCGVVVSAGDGRSVIKGLAGAIQRYSMQPTLATHEGRNAREYAMAHHRWSTRAIELLSYYTDALYHGQQQEGQPRGSAALPVHHAKESEKGDE